MEVVRAIENVKTDENDRPKTSVVITECGELPVDTPFVVNSKIGSEE